MEKEEKIDARGLACPQPVVLAKKGLEKADRIAIVVDDQVALENIKRLGESLGCDIRVEKTGEGVHEIHLTKSRSGASENKSQDSTAPTGSFVMVFSSDKMGRGEDELGDVLIRAFIHTLCEQGTRPDKIIFYNTGVKLAAKGSSVVGDLKQLEAAGAELLLCGTCVKYFELSERIGAGTVSNMSVIAETLCGAGRLVTP